MNTMTTILGFDIKGVSNTERPERNDCTHRYGLHGHRRGHRLRHGTIQGHYP